MHICVEKSSKSLLIETRGTFIRCFTAKWDDAKFDAAVYHKSSSQIITTSDTNCCIHRGRPLFRTNREHISSDAGYRQQVTLLHSDRNMRMLCYARSYPTHQLACSTSFSLLFPWRVDVDVIRHATTRYIRSIEFEQQVCFVFMTAMLDAFVPPYRSTTIHSPRRSFGVHRGFSPQTFW